jgi:dTMP kinase
MKGKIFVIDGCDGAGGETQSNLLKSNLESIGIIPVLLRYPDAKSDIGKIIYDFLEKRKDLNVNTQFLFYSLDFIKDVEKIKEYLNQGKIIICDRYFTSTLAYQTVQGFDLSYALEFAEKFGIIKPDVVFLLKIRPETSLMRKSKEKGSLDRFESNIELQKKVMEKFEELANKNIFAKKWVIIDAEQNIEKVSKDIFEIVKKEIGYDE